MITSKVEIAGERDDLKAYFDALQPEADFKNARAEYKLKLIPKKLMITISAKDVTAFRATINSLAGLMSVVDKTLRDIKQL